MVRLGQEGDLQMEQKRTRSVGGREEDAGDAGLMESKVLEEGREGATQRRRDYAELTSAAEIQKR